MVLMLKRNSFTQYGTFGTLSKVSELGTIPFCVTLEPEWLDNEENKSCIPSGTYQCKLINSPKFGRTFQVQNVKDRANILFHSGNTEDQTHGCILCGDGFSYPTPGVIFSKVAFQKFMQVLAGQLEFTLIITNP